MPQVRARPNTSGRLVRSPGERALRVNPARPDLRRLPGSTLFTQLIRASHFTHHCASLCGHQALTSRTSAISHAIADIVPPFFCILSDSNVYASGSALGLPLHYHLNMQPLDETTAECNRSFVSGEELGLRL
jgi:hypothetical protein